MNTKFRPLFTALALLLGVHRIAAQNAVFIRISGPTATTITAFQQDGSIVWSNAQPGATYNIQTASSVDSIWTEYVEIPITNGINTNKIVDFNPPAGMKYIPAGTFTIGDTLDGESDAPPTNVYVSGFYMDVNLVSYCQWQEVYNWATSQGYSFANSGAGKAPNHPVQMVDWYDCVKWCNARSQRAGLIPVYYDDAGMTQVLTNGNGTGGWQVFPNWTANGYRLPTEAEWEKAARGGLIGHRFPWGDTISWNQANYYGEPLSIYSYGFAYDLATAGGYDPNFNTGTTPNTSPVGSFPANGYGLNDMAGNVNEWCWDAYSSPFQSGSPYLGGTDPHGPEGAIGDRVLRGGVWNEPAGVERCAYRSEYDPANTFNNTFGFRCVKVGGGDSVVAYPR